MRGFGALLFVVGALCAVAALIDLVSAGAWIAGALNAWAQWMQSSSFGIKNTALCLYGGTALGVVGLVMLMWKRPRFHRH